MAATRTPLQVDLLPRAEADVDGLVWPPSADELDTIDVVDLRAGERPPSVCVGSGVQAPGSGLRGSARARLEGLAHDRQSGRTLDAPSRNTAELVRELECRLRAPGAPKPDAAVVAPMGRSRSLVRTAVLVAALAGAVALGGYTHWSARERAPQAPSSDRTPGAGVAAASGARQLASGSESWRVAGPGASPFDLAAAAAEEARLAALRRRPDAPSLSPYLRATLYQKEAVVLFETGRADDAVTLMWLAADMLDGIGALPRP